MGEPSSGRCVSVLRDVLGDVAKYVKWLSGDGSTLLPLETVPS